jgi:hypothetical protein
MGEKMKAFMFLVGKPEGKRPLGGPRRRCMNNIKMDLREKLLCDVTELVWLRIGTSRGLL